MTWHEYVEVKSASKVFVPDIKSQERRDENQVIIAWVVIITDRVEALLGEKVEIRLLNAVYWVENPI